MIRKLAFTLRFCLPLLVAMVSYAQNKPLNVPHQFRYYTNKDGLPQNTVKSIVQDKLGFMWIATANGLAKFDGHDFTYYNKDGIGQNHINSISQDNKNMIWLATFGGLRQVDLITEKEVAIEIRGEQPTGVLNVCFTDQKNNIWVGGKDGLWLISLRNGKYVSKELPFNSKGKRQVFSIYQLNNGTILIGTDQGIYAYNPLQSLHLWHSDLNNMTVYTLFENQNGDIWVGTFYGLLLLSDNKKQKWFFHDPLTPKSLLHNSIRAICADKNGRIYIGSLGGVEIFNNQDSSFIDLPNKNIPGFSLNNPFVNCIYIDQIGDVWIGTEKGGINLVNSNQKPFYFLVHSEDDPKSLSNNTINSVLKLNNTLWVGTAGGGLNAFAGGGKDAKHYVANIADQQSLKSNFISVLLNDRHNNLWVGTWGGGLEKMLNNGGFKHFLPNTTDPYSLTNVFVSSLCRFRQDLMLVGTEGGIYTLNTTKEKFENPIALNPNISKITEVGCMLIDKDSTLWVGTRNGLYHLSILPTQPLMFDVLSVKNQPDIRKRPAADYVTWIMQDSRSWIWTATYGEGISVARRTETGTWEFEHIGTEQGLSNNVVYSLQEGPNGQIWCSTDYGISCYDPHQKTFHNYFSQDGLVSDQFYWGASYRDSLGLLYFGSLNGLTYFNPAEFSNKTLEVPVRFTRLTLGGRTVEIAQKYHGETVIPQSISLAPTVNFSYKDNVFSIEFVSLDFFSAPQKKYAYKLEGVDKDWVYVPASRRTANYTNLSGGDYLFMVKATNQDGSWGKEVAKLHIHINPPIWQTTSFRIFSLIVMILLAVMYARYYSRRLLLQKKILEEKVRERTLKIAHQSELLQQQADELLAANKAQAIRQKQIEAHRDELEEKNHEILLQHDKLAELNAEIEQINKTRLLFFTNISHEFRTPLTLILAPIEALLKLALPENAQEHLGIIARNAKRLDTLIEQLLFFRKIETKNLVPQRNVGSLRNFTQQVIYAFAGMADKRHIDLKLKYRYTQDFVSVDFKMLENILFNLLSNAFKYTPDGQQIELTVRNHEESGGFQIIVSDTGIGIPADKSPRIFDRFYRVSTKNLSVEGMGIGLSLVKEFVELMEGIITLESKLNFGSIFTIVLPYYAEEVSANPEEHNLERLREKVSLFIDTGEIRKEFRSRNQGQHSILIAEDNPEMLNLLSNTLGEHYHILSATNGKEALSLIKKHSPDLVISDVMMPIMGGLELCKNIKSSITTSHIPVILLTAKVLIENQIEGLEIGAEEYLLKPFHPNILLAKVENLLTIRDKYRQLYNTAVSSQDNPDGITPLDAEFLKKLEVFTEANYADPEFNIDRIADSLFVSRSLLYKKLKALTDLSPNDFITVFRLKKAVKLLGENKLSINEVAYSIGFNDPKYFSRVFRKYYKMSPSEFSAQNTKDASK